MDTKILVLTPDLKVHGGVSNYYEAIRLNEIGGVKYFFITSDKKEFFLGIVWRMFRNYFLFLKMLVDSKIELIHVNPSLNLKSFLRDAFFIILSHLFNKPTLIFFHGWSDEFEMQIRKNFLLRKLFLLSFGQSEFIVVLSNQFKEKLTTLGCDAEKTKFWVETTVADTSFLEQFSLEQKLSSYQQEVRILFLSRVEESKGIFIALAAFEKLQHEVQNKKMVLIIAGDGSALAQAKAMVDQREIPNVKFTGYIRGKAKKEVLHEAHIFLFPTYYGEGMPTNILEAMLYGMPIISRFNAGIADTVIHGCNGFLTESVEAIEFTEMLKVVLSDDNLYAEMVRKNHHKALENYSSEKVRERILKIYNGIINDKNYFEKLKVSS
jgi:glycosyltransferase involved in cell wall biosynthesis